jgi:hypothetical protein
VSINDYDPEGDNTTFALITEPAHGSLTFNSDGTFNYVPVLDYIGPDQFIYTVCDDGEPIACSASTVYINVSEVNHAPVAVDDFLIRDQASVNILSNDYDPDGDQIILKTTPLSGPYHGTIVLHADGTFVYTPEPFLFWA